MAKRDKIRWLAGLTFGAVGGWLASKTMARGGNGRAPLSGHDATAVITGASSGIGAAFARQLAMRGFDVMLVARRASKLEALAAELQETYGVITTVLPADLATAEGIEKVAHALTNISNLTVLVNNAGFGTSGKLAEIDVEKQTEMLTLHVDATMRLCHAALQPMLKRKRGAIINVSSVVAFLTGSGSANYCASKSYINSFSSSLQKEVAADGIIVQALCPGYTLSEFHDSPEYKHFDRGSMPQFLWMTADETAAASLEALGNGSVVFVPKLINKVIVAGARTGLTGMIMGVRDVFMRSKQKK